VCLAPRGLTPQTFRLYEGARAGCAIVCERLPHLWFYDGAPFVFVDDWRDLVEILPPQLDDPLRLEDLHKKTMEWWESKFSPAAVGAFMVRSLAERFIR
jgi:hypothetical protein